MQALGVFLSRVFTSPLMLVALVLVLIPIIIEWLFRKRRRQVELPTIRFLLRNKEQERVRRQDLLLLILRMIGIFLIVLALTRPVVRHGWMGAGRQRNVVVLLDATASMNQQVGVTTAFGLAQRKAAEMVRGLPKGTSVTVGSLGERAQTEVKDETDVHTAAAKVEALRAGSGAAPMSDALDWVKSSIEKKTGVEVYLFSDFQKSTWLTPRTSAPEMARALNEVGRGNEFYVVDVGGAPEYNLMVTDLSPAERVLSARMPVTFNVTIDSTGKPPADARATITLLVNGDKKGIREVPVGGGPLRLAFEHTFADPGEYLVEVLLEDDMHRVDNRRFYLCDVQEDLRVLVLDETADAPMPDSIYLARAIAPAGRPGMPKVSRFATNVVTPARVAYENLNRYVGVVLVGSGFLRADMVSKLEQYVRDGGALWLFMSDRINFYEYNKLLFNKGAGLLPCALKEKTAAEKPDLFHDLETLEISGEITPQPGIKDATVAYYVGLDLKPGNPSDSRVLYKLSNGAPALVERTFGRGKVLLSTTSAGVQWDYLPARPEFAIYVQEVLRYLVGDPNRPVNLSVGDKFQQPVFVSAQHLVLRYPDGRRTRLTPRPHPTVADAWSVEFTETNQQGPYAVDAIQEVLGRRRFVVNQSRAEGDLARLTRDGFSDAFGSGSWRWIPPETPLADFVASLHAVTELAPTVLWTLAVTLAVESFLAVWFGRRRGGATV